MPCWADVWQHLRDDAPLISMLLALFVYGSVVALLLWAPRVPGKRLRLTCRIVGIAGLLPLLVLLPPMLFGLFLASGDPPVRTRVIASPTQEQATLVYHAGFLGRDYTEVKLKQPGCCQHTRVFSHSGPSEFTDPQVEWVGANHLRIRYHTRPGDPQFCAGELGRIHIDCEAVRWPQQ
jgi:hypothetical protein